VIFSILVWYPGVTTITQEAWLKTKLYLEFGEITKDGNFATSEHYFYHSGIRTDTDLEKFIKT